MQHQDIYGCDVALSDPKALTSWNHTLHGFLAHSASTGENLTKTLTNCPDFVLGHVTKGFFNLLLGRKELIPVADQAFKTAQHLTKEGYAAPRDILFSAALEHWLEGRPSQSVKVLEQILEKDPRDPLAMKLSQAIQFIMGDIRGMRRSAEKIYASYTEDHPAYGYFMGCYAFCLEETGDYKNAELCGRKGLEFSPDDAWGLHAIAHVYDMTGNAKDGVKWLNSQEKAWQHCNNFRYHVWWHLALMHLDLGNIDTVLHLYDTEIRHDKTDDYRDISNATSLLMRLELEGVHVGNRWEELAALCETRADDTTLAFADLHYMLALCGGEKTQAAHSLLKNMKACHGTNCELGQIVSDPGVSAARGLEAFREDDYAGAYTYLSQARASLQSIGGSHAQRDVFERITIEAAIRAGLLEQAVTLLQQRKLRRGYEDGYSVKRLALIHTFRQQSDTASDTRLADTAVR